MHRGRSPTASRHPRLRHARQGRAHTLRLDVAKYVLHYYNTYFGIPYPLKKLDLIALPDFEAGAMENFGAITYRETDLLIDPKTASVKPKRKWLSSSPTRWPTSGSATW
jgi:hypothetical protein